MAIREKSMRDSSKPRWSARSFIRTLKDRFFLRFHMSLILTVTVLSGLLTSKLLLLASLDNIVLRYPLAVICSYGVFFLCVKIWLAYIFSPPVLKAADAVDLISPDLDFPSGGGPSLPSGPSFGGGGRGMSGGGGASGSFEIGVATPEGPIAPVSTAGNSSSGSGGGIGDALSGIFDDDGVIIIALIVLVAAVLGSAFYLIYIAPHILTEAAFNAVLAGGLVKRYKAMREPDWIGSVFKDTYKPFFAVLLVSAGAAWVIHDVYPEVTSLMQLFSLL